MTVKNLPTDRLDSIDCLRGVAALMVAMAHCFQFAESGTQVAWSRAIRAVSQQGYIGVPLFFVISGFCIHLRWARRRALGEDRPRLDFGAFWRRRLLRLYPTYFVALTLVMALVLLAFCLHQQIARVLIYPEPRKWWIALDYIAHLLMLHGLHPLLDRGTSTGVFWTLAREEYYYALYFLLLWWRGRFSVRSIALWTLLLALGLPPLAEAISGCTSAIGLTFARCFVLALWFQWCLGMVAVEAYFGLIRLPRIFGAGIMVPVWCALAYCCSRALQEPLSPPYAYLTQSLWGMAGFTLINYCVARERAGRWSTHGLIRWLTHVGVFSYSLYLIHTLVHSLYQRAVGRLAQSANPWLYLFNSIGSLVLSYFAARLLFVLVEQHCLGRKTKPQVPLLQHPAITAALRAPRSDTAALPASRSDHGGGIQ